MTFAEIQAIRNDPPKLPYSALMIAQLGAFIVDTNNTMAERAYAINTFLLLTAGPDGMQTPEESDEQLVNEYMLNVF